MQVRIKKLDERAKIPTYGTDFSAGADLYNMEGNDITLKPHETVMVKLGFAIEIPEGYAGLVFARSGLASKRGLAPANKVGVIDSDYRGEVMVALHNHGTKAQTIEEGKKATKPADPTKAGYDFKGWTLNGSAYDFNSAVNGDITLVATWETIPAGHTCDIKPVAKVEPSCTEGGKEAYYKCEGCGKFYEDALGAKEITDLAAWGNIAKNGHTESDWKTDKDNHWKECTVAACGVIIENSKAAHADANNDGKCDTCEYNVGTTTTNPDNKPSDDVQSPQTGDNSMMWLWVALLFVSGFGVVATTVIGKKKSSAK